MPHRRPHLPPWIRMQTTRWTSALLTLCLLMTTRPSSTIGQQRTTEHSTDAVTVTISAKAAALCRAQAEAWKEKTRAVDKEAARRRACEAARDALVPTVTDLRAANEALRKDVAELRDSRNRWAAVAVVGTVTAVGIVLALFLAPAGG